MSPVAMRAGQPVNEQNRWAIAAVQVPDLVSVQHRRVHTPSGHGRPPLPTGNTRKRILLGRFLARHMPKAQDESVNPSERYLLDNRQVEAGLRFDALSVLFNPSTFRHARTIGLTAGWSVWEGGAGSPSAPAYFAAQVGPKGH